ncbi:SMI1/KNR4 family protein [Streptomyces sp. NPDC056534]|uniref:SMI1/KNR4 family protein n=1 Tax=Streptomyces sp. NPDC056534 TaxID=3345857 RepID=UPI00368BF539
MENIANYFAWIKECSGKLGGALRNPAGSGDLAQLEQTIGFRLPEDMCEMFRMHAGQRECGESCQGCIGAIYGLHFLTPAEVAAEWAMWADFRNGYTADELANQFDRYEEVFVPKVVAKAYSKPGWVPLFRCPGRNDYFGVDLQPEGLGKYGQVINFGRDEPKKYVAAVSLDQFFSKLLSWGSREITATGSRAEEQTENLFGRNGGALLFNRFYGLADGREPAL